MAYELLSDQGGGYEMLPPVKLKPDFNLKGEGYDAMVNYNPTNTVAGMVRGAGSLGATVLAPWDVAQGVIAGDGVSLAKNQERRDKMDQGLRYLGADPSSTAFKTSKLATEVAGTSGLGGLVAKGISLIPGASAALPTLLPAIQSGGFSANGATGLYGMANRVAGGAINGAVVAGAVDPKDTGTGMTIGGALPVAAKAIGETGKFIGQKWQDLWGKPINPTLLQTARESVDAGYVIPPNMVAPSAKSRILESFSGKQATQQIASTKNNAVTEQLTREALGIAPDVPLTQATLEGLRKTAGKAYGEVSSLSPQAAADLEALKLARADASAWFKAYNRSAHPNDLAQAKQFRAAADALETSLEQHAAAAGRKDLIPALRDARKEIAKTYTVGRALNDAAGTVDARVFGRMYEKGLPLSDGLEVAGKFASAFPTVSKSTQQMGSPAARNLTALLATGLGVGGGAGAAATGAGLLGTGGAGLAAAAVPFVVPAASRSIMFSGPVQRAMVQQPTQGLLSQSIDELLPMIYRSAPALSGR